MERKEFKKIEIIRNKENKKCKNILPLYPQYFGDNKIYVDRILEGLEDNNIFNIGVTGSYGSGKSSVLKGVYQNINKKKYNKIVVSLANFINKNYDKEENKDSVDNELEIGILQQLIYNVSSRKIPLSRFNRIKDIGEWPFILICTFITYIVFWEKIKKFFESFIEINTIFYILTFIVMYLGIYIILKKFNINSLRFNGIELSKEKNSDDESILNKYIDEIIYFFKKTKYNVVVFEDIDRFGNINIFYKLREINKIINDNDEIKKRKRVIFIYAIRDDALKESSDRTKFFDLIIPVIPVISSANANYKFIETLKEIGLDNVVSLNIIEELSYYVEDMRCLKNICSEFKIHYEQILKKANRLDKNSVDSLFALMVYKNINHKDYEDMRKRRRRYK